MTLGFLKLIDFEVMGKTPFWLNPVLEGVDLVQ